MLVFSLVESQPPFALGTLTVRLAMELSRLLQTLYHEEVQLFTEGQSWSGLPSSAYTINTPPITDYLPSTDGLRGHSLAI